jgi:hypothetical protein
VTPGAQSSSRSLTWGCDGSARRVGARVCLRQSARPAVVVECACSCTTRAASCWPVCTALHWRVCPFPIERRRRHTSLNVRPHSVVHKSCHAHGDTRQQKERRACLLALARTSHAAHGQAGARAWCTRCRGAAQQQHTQVKRALSGSRRCCSTHNTQTHGSGLHAPAAFGGAEHDKHACGHSWPTMSPPGHACIKGKQSGAQSRNQSVAVCR